jgi:hypothetical protein
LAYYAPSPGESIDFSRLFSMVDPDKLKQKLEKSGFGDFQPAIADMMKHLSQAGPQKRSISSSPNDPAVMSDPLVVWGDADFLLMLLDENEDSQEQTGENTRNSINISPDVNHKSNISGGDGYDLLLPDPAADAILEGCEGRLTFVSYLRNAFQWGGFPGLEGQPDCPTAILDRLRADLLPI